MISSPYQIPNCNHSKGREYIWRNDTLVPIEKLGHKKKEMPAMLGSIESFGRLVK
jgi:hypothetical protein